MDFFSFINIATAVVTVASFVANLTPTKKDDAAVNWLSNVINLMALNITTPGGVIGKPPQNTGALKSLLLCLIIVGATVIASPQIANAQTASARLQCDAPTLREDNTPLAAEEIAGYRYWRAGVALNPDSLDADCDYVVILAPGECVKASEPFQVAVYATGTPGGDPVASQRSQPAFAAADICNPKAGPAAPGNVTVIRF